MSILKIKQPRILLIDDDELSAATYARRLEKRGFAVDVLIEGEHVMALLMEKHFDLILLDIVMPKKDGLTLLAEIRRQFKIDELPVIMVTVQNSHADIAKAFELGANDYIKKPMNIEACVARIKGQLSRVLLEQERILKAEVDSIQALVTTYHHEINNPLTVAIHQADAMKRELSETQHERLDLIRRSLWHMHSILEQIKEMSERGHVEYTEYAGSTKMLKTIGENK